MRQQELQDQRKTAAVKLLWPLPQPCVTNKGRTWEAVYPNLQISNWMWFNVSNLFKSSESAGIWNGWIASPVASRSAERRDTSAMVFEDSLPKSDMPHSPEQAIRAWRCETKHWKEMPVCCNMKPNMCLLQLCSFFVGDFGLQFIVWDQTLQQQWTSPVIYSHLLICLGHEHAQKSDRACVLDLSSKSLWSSLVSCEDVTQARNQSMAPSST